jgi:hypothetical protein
MGLYFYTCECVYIDLLNTNPLLFFLQISSNCSIDTSCSQHGISNHYKPFKTFTYNSFSSHSHCKMSGVEMLRNVTNITKCLVATKCFGVNTVKCMVATKCCHMNVSKCLVTTKCFGGSPTKHLATTKYFGMNTTKHLAATTHLKTIIFLLWEANT